MGTQLAPFLNRLYGLYHRKEYLGSDPLEFPHRFSDPWDQEAVALVSALMAYGNVTQIRRSVSGLLERISSLGLSPSAFVRSLGEPEKVTQAKRKFQGFVHRFNPGSDWVELLRQLERSWRIHGSLGAHFLRYLEPDAETFEQALNQLIADWKRGASRAVSGSFFYLLTAPEDGSCCKRWCMFLRWMGRPEDGLDLGLWAVGGKLASTFPLGRSLSARQLVLPLDTHTSRISRTLGLTQRKSADWKAALEVTRSLRVCHGEDPTRYDFALSRVGILDLYDRYRMEMDSKCAPSLP